jgi:hypothetical protein
LQEHGLVRNQRAEHIEHDSTIVLTKSGGYYAKVLSRRFVYVEECMFDTAIEERDVWTRLHDLTIAVEGERYPSARMEVRRERMRVFLDYLVALEDETLALLRGSAHLPSMRDVREAVLLEVEDALTRARRYEPEDVRTL